MMKISMATIIDTHIYDDHHYFTLVHIESLRNRFVMFSIPSRPNNFGETDKFLLYTVSYKSMIYLILLSSL